MSEHIIKIITSNPYDIISLETLEEVKSFLISNISCDYINVECNEYPVFVDCGSNLETIFCPKCETELSFDWWGNKMNIASKCSFQHLEIELPCCTKIVSLNDLKYNYKCGFSCSVIEIFNPTNEFNQQIINSIQMILGTNINLINAHM